MSDSIIPPLRVGVIGGGSCSPRHYEIARDVGHLIASEGAILVCGGLGGVMEGAAKGAREGGGLTVGILPSREARDANPYITLPIPTGLGYARNALVVQSSQLIVAIDGKTGTLSELAFALTYGKPIIGFETWDVDTRIQRAKSREELLNLITHQMRAL